MGLWLDLTKLSQTDFEAELDKLSDKKPRPKAKKSPAKPRAKAVPANDKPLTRIVFALRNDAGLQDAEAMKLLHEQLLARGLDAQKLPGPDPTASLDEWIERVLSLVSSSVVMDAAMKVGLGVRG